MNYAISAATYVVVFVPMGVILLLTLVVWLAEHRRGR